MDIVIEGKGENPGDTLPQYCPGQLEEICYNETQWGLHESTAKVHGRAGIRCVG